MLEHNGPELCLPYVTSLKRVETRPLNLFHPVNGPELRLPYVTSPKRVKTRPLNLFYPVNGPRYYITDC